MISLVISLNEIRNRAVAFSKEWERDYNEDAEAKSFWDGFFEVFGVSRRRVATFEYPVKKIDGGQGYIDVIWKGVMLAEHKTRGKSLDKAYTQAKDYCPGLRDAELPKYIIVSDFEKIKIYNFEKEEPEEFLLKDLHKNIDLFDFISGHKTIFDYGKEEMASVEAAELMADFHNEIAKTGYSGHDLEVFLIRILFCLFADDTGIFPKNSFRNYIENRVNIDGSDLGMHLSQIFQILNTPNKERQSNLDESLAILPYVNGGIFAENIGIVSCDATAVLRLIKCCSFDWSEISASIFGSLFQGVIDKEARRHLGAHYTSELNILKVIQSLFLEELYIEFDKVKYELRKLDDFHKKLATLKFLDPACGCGNFLVVTYRELRKLELEVLKQKQKIGDLMLLDAQDMSILNINQFYGIEIEESPTLIARVAMYLVDHQMNNLLSQYFGKIYARIPLREPATIANVDALTTDWENIVPKDKLSYILGNPPFVGSKLMSEKDRKNLIACFDNNSGVGVLDFVTAWYAKAAKYIAKTDIKVAFVSTNSITQGEQVGILWSYLNNFNIEIQFAHQTFRWNNDAPGVAAVGCVIIGFGSKNKNQKYLYEYENIKSEPKEVVVSHINAYLVKGDDVFINKKSNPICKVPEMSFGNMPLDGGNLLLTDEEKEQFIIQEPKAEKFIRPLISAKEFLNNQERWCLWLVDAEPQELRTMPLVLERIQKVKEFREKSIAPSTKKFATTPALFRDRNNPDSSIVIPRVSSENRKYIPMGFFQKDSIVSDTCMSLPGGTLYHFGILESEMHMTWVSYTCGRLESRFRYSKDVVYNNFPWPEKISDEHKKKVEEYVQEVLDARLKFSHSSLADLYDPNTMPEELVKAHTGLDRAVDACYGKKFSNKEERIEFLFDLYKKYTL